MPLSTPQPPRGNTRNRWRPMALAGVVMAVVVVHAVVSGGLFLHMRSLSAQQALTIKRMEAGLLAEMELTEPPVVVAPPPAPPTPAQPEPAPAEQAPSKPEKPKPAKKPAKPASAASQPEADNAAKALAAASSASQAHTETAPNTDQASAMAEAGNTDIPPDQTASAPEPAASAPVFEWPRATRVTYKMEGYYRGPAYGSAKVEWVREDSHYQVHIDMVVGPRFAPAWSMLLTSEGTLLPQGLSPERFESVRSRESKAVDIEDTEVVMPNGARLPKLPGVQDPASHMIQMAYQFILNPRKLAVGQVIEVPLVWTKRQEVLYYDVETQEQLSTPLGMLDTFKLRPRKLTDAKPTDTMPEIWVAPSLQYLPVRMLMRMGPETYVDAQMDKAPQQAPAEGPDAIKRKPRNQTRQQAPATSGSDNSPSAFEISP